mmetsp:Transcript_22568/g.70036  ORF Transcript_22568/g.70036 Transcript_22568/m.70036 type:complete len:318 (-) Transcript_22568:455-1408(-)
MERGLPTQGAPGAEGEGARRRHRVSSMMKSVRPWAAAMGSSRGTLNLGPRGAGTVLAVASASILLVWTLFRVVSNKGVHEVGGDHPAPEAKPAAPGRIGGNKARLAKYAEMSKAFAAKGFDLKAITKARSNFGGFQEKDWPVVWPKKYTENGLCFPCVRLLVIPLEPFTAFTAKAAAAARDVMAALPRASTHMNGRSSYHITLFHTSHPDQVRPRPLVRGGGVGPDIKYPQEPEGFDLQKEHAEVARTTAAAEGPVLRLERITMTPSGTLLALWTEVGESIDGLRRTLRRNFPGAPTVQVGCILKEKRPRTPVKLRF